MNIILSFNTHHYLAMVHLADRQNYGVSNEKKISFIILVALLFVGIVFTVSSVVIHQSFIGENLYTVAGTQENYGFSGKNSLYS